LRNLDDRTPCEKKLALFFNFSKALYLFFINESDTKTFGRLSGITVKNFSQIGSIVFSVSAVVENPLQFYIPNSSDKTIEYTYTMLFYFKSNFSILQEI